MPAPTVLTAPAPAPGNRRGRARLVLAATVGAVLVVAAVLAAEPLARLLTRPAGATNPNTVPDTSQESAWVPSGWTLALSAAPGTLWRANDKCTPTDTYLSVNTTTLAGCAFLPALDRRFSSVAVEVQVAIDSGCAVLWTRTSNRGYVLLLCEYGLALHRLGDEGPSAENLLGQAPIDDAKDLRLGMLAQGPHLTVYANGKAVITVTNGEIASGRVNLGATINGPAGGTSAAVTFRDLRIWQP